MKHRSRHVAPLGVISRIEGVHLMQAPSGRWVFRGRVPSVLSYSYLDGSPLSAEDARDVAQHGAGLFKSRIKSVSFSTAEEACAAAAAIGVKVIG